MSSARSDYGVFLLLTKNYNSIVFENHRKSLSIASEASYVYILSAQKFIKKVNFKLSVKQCYQTGLK